MYSRTYHASKPPAARWLRPRRGRAARPALATECAQPRSRPSHGCATPRPGSGAHKSGPTGMRFGRPVAAAAPCRARRACAAAWRASGGTRPNWAAGSRCRQCPPGADAPRACSGGSHPAPPRRVVFLPWTGIDGLLRPQARSARIALLAAERTVVLPSKGAARLLSRGKRFAAPPSDCSAREQQRALAARKACWPGSRRAARASAQVSAEQAMQHQPWPCTYSRPDRCERAPLVALAARRGPTVLLPPVAGSAPRPRRRAPHGAGCAAPTTGRARARPAPRSGTRHPRHRSGSWWTRRPSPRRPAQTARTRPRALRHPHRLRPLGHSASAHAAAAPVRSVTLCSTPALLYRLQGVQDLRAGPHQLRTRRCPPAGGPVARSAPRSCLAWPHGLPPGAKACSARRLAQRPSTGAPARRGFYTTRSRAQLLFERAPAAPDRH